MTDLIRTVGGVETRFQCSPEVAEKLAADPRFKPAPANAPVKASSGGPKKWGKSAGPDPEPEEADPGD